MSKGLEALERIKKLSCVWDSSNDDYRCAIDIVPYAFKVVEKELKALEIIKYYYDDAIEDLIEEVAQSKEERELLKEVLL